MRFLSTRTNANDVHKDQGQIMLQSARIKANDVAKHKNKSKKFKKHMNNDN